MANADALSAPVILIVAESPAELAALSLALEQQGLRPLLLTRADSALEALSQGDIAVALIDIGLRQRNGFDLCKLVKTSDSTRHIPVFLMTSSPNAAERQRSSECGASDYLARPLDAALAVEKILVQLSLSQSLVMPLKGNRPQPAMHALEVNYHALLANSPDSVVLLDLDSGRLVDANSNACMLFGLPESALLNQTLCALCPPLQPDGQASAQVIDQQIQEVVDGVIRVFDATFRHSSGRALTCEMRLVLLPTAGARLMHVRIVDVTQRALADKLRIGQGNLLELIARGAPLRDTLDNLMLLIESQSDQVLCSVLLIDDDGVTMRSASGPSLPPAYMAALDGVAMGEGVGSCGTAMFRMETVIVSDIARDPLWAPYAALAAPHGLRACWSTPIYLDKHHLLGSFAMYYREVRRPGPDDMRLIAVATHLAGIAIERTRRERELALHREHLEVLVARRTAELTLSKERVEQANEELASTLDTLSLAQEELVRRDKLAALGALVAGVAHELNTPIGNSLVVATTMAEQARTLAANIGDGLRRSDLETFLARAEEANQILARNLKRAATLVASFKQLAVDHASSQRRVFVLDELIDNMLPTLKIAVKNRTAALAPDAAIALSADIAPGLSMDSYPGPLAEVLTSLFDNCMLHAFDSQHGGAIRISAITRGDGQVSIAVADNGVGIPAAVAGRVYDPFFTTKLGSGGSGLGLHVVHNIVTGILGGRIELLSEPGQGTRFTLLLPAAAPAVLVAEQADAERA